MKTFHDNETVRTAHELRTPLHGILGLARQGLAAGTPEEKDACLAAVLRAGEQLMELVSSLLSPADGPKAADYDLRDLADGVETLLRAYAGADRTVTVTVQDSAPRRLNGDAGAIRQILLNLGGNAVKYAAPGPVEITLSVDDAGVLTAAVADHGPGIPPEKLENLFCPGVRDAAGEGSGLGLAVSRSLAESMGGTLTAQSRVGQGSVFTLRVPQKPAQAVHPWTAPDARVLIADDSPISLLATAGLLRTWAIDPVTVKSGGEVPELAVEGFDLILLDAVMPDLSGPEVLCRLRVRGVTVPALAVTGLDAGDPALAGFDEVLTKPLTGESLGAALLRHLPAEKIRYD